MNKKRHSFVRNAVAVLAATPLLWIVPSVNAQSSSPSSPENRTSPNPNSDITSQELARFDQFLDNHREIAEQLRHDPSLVNDQNYVQEHAELQTFLQDHPGVREEIKENPNYFMRQENRYDRREEAREDNRREELARFDQFLDRHREIAEQLRRDPSLVTNQQFVSNHPALQSYLQDHPAVREDLTRNPDAFMRQEQRYDRREDANRDEARNRFDNRQDNDVRQDRDSDRRDADRRDNDRRAQLAQFDRFLDSHREIAEQLRRDPSLVKNQQFLQNHPALQTYLQEHQDIRQRLDQNPNALMRQENRFDNNERDAGNRDYDNDARRDNDNRNGVSDRNDNRMDNDRGQDARNRDHGQVASFDQFLDKHREIAEQLRRDPSLAKNQQFVSNHPALQAYLQDHQGVREELNQNPNAFMQQENRYDSRENGMARSGMNREQYSFGQFLGTHSAISEQLSKDPSLLKNREYMSSHPELQAYLKAHPDAQNQMAQNPDRFIKSSQQFSSGTKTGTTTGTTGTVKTTTPDAAKPSSDATKPSTDATKPPKQQ